MPVSESDYHKAVSAVKSGSAPDDVLDGLMDIIDEYEKAKPQASPAVASSRTNFGEGGSILGTGPTGMDVLAKEIRPPEEHEDIQKSLDKNPKIAESLRLPEVQKRMPLVPGSRMEEERERLRIEGERNDERYDKTLPTASKRKETHLSAPPEFIPEQPPATAMGGATNPFDAFSASLDKARSNLPAFAGGKVEHYLEPPLEQFRRETARTLGDQVLGMGVGDDAYLEYADQLWTKIYNQAKAEGRHVVRTAYKGTKNWRDVVEKGAAEGIGALAGAARGVDEAAFGGMVSRAAAGGDKEQLENYKRLGEGAPLSHLGGQLVGGASPIGMGGLASRGLGKALPEAGNAVTAAMRGGAQAAGSGAATTSSMAFADDRAPTGGELALGAGLALPFGLVGGAHGKMLRDSSPALELAESSRMGETSVLRGVRPTSKANAISKQARAATGQSGREVDYLSKELEGPLAESGRRLQAETERGLGETKDSYFKATENDRKPLGSFVKDALELRKGLTTPEGRPIPKKEANIKFLDDLIEKSTHSAEIIPAAGEGRALVRASRPGTIDLSPEEAERMGIDVTRKMEAYMGSGQQVPQNFVVRVTPRELNAREMELMKGQMDLELRMGDNPNRQELNPLLRSAREVRDQYPAKGPISDELRATVDTGTEEIGLKGFSAFQRQAAEKTGEVKRTLGMAGLPESVPEALGAGEAQKFQGAIGGYRQTGRSTDIDAALRELAGLANKTGELEAVAGMRGLKQVKGGIPTSRAGLLEQGRFRLDPLLQFFGPGMGAVAPGAARKMSGHQQLPPQLDPAMLEQYMGIAGPFGGPF